MKKTLACSLAGFDRIVAWLTILLVSVENYRKTQGVNGKLKMSKQHR